MSITTKSSTSPKQKAPRRATREIKTKTETLPPKTLRDRLDHYFPLALKIYSSSGSPNKLISEFPLDQAILDLELALGVKIIESKLSISQHPPLTEDIEGNYPRKWGLIIKASDLLCALYNLRGTENNNASDTYRTDYLKEFCQVMRHIKGSYDGCPDRETNGTRSRLRNLSRSTGIGRKRFNERIEDKQLLALSIWIAKEYANKTHPMPEFHLSDMIKRRDVPIPTPSLVTAASVGAKARVEKQGLLF